MKNLIAFWLLFLSFSAFSQSPDKLWYNQPAQYFEESLVLGNGSGCEEQQRREVLMQRIDQLNRRYGSGTVRWAACGLQSNWMMRRDKLSRAATTRLSDLPTAWAR